jgi:hypothetical protein
MTPSFTLQDLYPDNQRRENTKQMYQDRPNVINVLYKYPSRFVLLPGGTEISLLPQLLEPSAAPCRLSEF